MILTIPLSFVSNVAATGPMTDTIIFVEVDKNLAAQAVKSGDIDYYIFGLTPGQVEFFTPSAILSEAALSFLGLGDPGLPTWGQILEYGFRNGAVYLGYWWWILPPGLLIIFSAVTFVLISLGLEPIVNPRLRRRR